MKPIKFFPRLPIQVFAIHHKQALFNIRVILQQRRSLKRSQGFTAARRMPDITIAAVLVNALHDRLNRINLIGTHHHQLLLTGHQHHIPADHLPQGTLHQKRFRKVIQIANFPIVFPRKLIDRQKALFRIKAKMAIVIIGKVPSLTAITDDKQLKKTQQGLTVAITGIIFIIHNLLHSAAGANVQTF